MNKSQSLILHFIKDYRLQHGMSPTYRIIADYMGQSVGGIQFNAGVLEANGYLTHIKGRAASFVPTEKEIDNTPIEHDLRNQETKGSGHTKGDTPVSQA